MPTYTVDEIIEVAPHLNSAALGLLAQLLSEESHFYSKQDWETICYVIKLTENDLAVKVA